MGNNVTTKWAGDDYTFGFNLAEIEELQRLCDAPLGAIIARVIDDVFDIRDIYHTIRLGLIGAGEVGPTRAKQLVDTYIVGKPLAGAGEPSSSLSVTKVILGNIMFGVAPASEPTPGEDEAGATDSSTFRPSEQPLGDPE